MNKRKRILTPADRLAHIKKCRNTDRRRKIFSDESYYEQLGDLATVNTNSYYDGGTKKLYLDTPKWIVGIAEKLNAAKLNRTVQP